MEGVEASSSSREEGAGLSPARPTTTNQELLRLGERILKDIDTIAVQGNDCDSEEGFMRFVEGLPTFCRSVATFVDGALAVCQNRDGIAHWVEETYKSVQKLVATPPVAVAKPSNPGPSMTRISYADAARRRAPLSENQLQLRQIKIRVSDPAERKKIWTTPNNIILQSVVEKTRTDAEAVGVKKLPSGDIVIQMREREGKEALSRQSAWVTQVSASAKILPDLYPVLVHGVRLSKVDTTKQSAAARDLEYQNASLHPGLRIERVAWPRGIRKDQQKKSSSLTVFLTSPEAANKVIREGLLESGEVHMAERFQTGCGLVQCYKCCAYGHIAKHCRAEARCGHCCASHETRECTKSKDITAKCANCRGQHKAWAEDCKVRSKLRLALAERLQSRTHLYPEVVSPDGRPALPLRPTQAVAQAVTAARKPARRGPRAVAVGAAAGTTTAGDGAARPPAKRQRQATLSQATLSFSAEGSGGA